MDALYCDLTGDGHNTVDVRVDTDGGHLSDDVAARVLQIDDALVDSHLVSVPRLRA